MVMKPEFEVTLFASEPDIVNPIDMAWDEQGRLWIAETEDYPNNMTDNREGNDRIKILEDTNGDGKADTFTIFAEGLKIGRASCRERVWMSVGVVVVEYRRMQ